MWQAKLMQIGENSQSASSHSNQSQSAAGMSAVQFSIDNSHLSYEGVDSMAHVSSEEDWQITNIEA